MLKEAHVIVFESVCQIEELLRNDHHQYSFQTGIEGQQSEEYDLSRYVVNGHYDFACFLVLIGITFLGEVVLRVLYVVRPHTTHTFTWTPCTPRPCCVAQSETLST